MSRIALSGNALGTGTFTIASPNSNSDRTLNLPDNSGTVLTSASTVAASQITGALNATGSAPIYACRAWVNFDGTGTVAIRASGNVSSITDVGVGRYRVNLTTAMPDVNYAVFGFCQPSVSNNGSDTFSNIADCTTSVVDFVHYEDGTTQDSNFVSVSVFR